MPARVRVTAYALVAAVSFVAAFAAGELVLRVKRGRPFDWRNELALRSSSTVPLREYRYDERLGWLPRRNGPYRHYDGTTVTILPHHLRGNGNWSVERVAVGDPPEFIATGDSLTFGDEVSDWDTWPAWLERLSGRRTLNGGVCAFAADQIFLRSIELARTLRPKRLLFSFILEDVPRMAFAVRHGSGKPYFALGSGGLELRNVPVPRDNTKAHLGPAKRILAHSLLFHSLALRLFPDLWLGNERVSRDSVSALVAADLGAGPTRIFCELMRELRNSLEREGVSPFLVLLPTRWDLGDGDREEPYRKCAERAGIAWINIAEEFRKALQEEPDRLQSLFLRAGHLSPEGNRFAAEQLWRRFKKM